MIVHDMKKSFQNIAGEKIVLSRPKRKLNTFTTVASPPSSSSAGPAGLSPHQLA